MNRLEKFIFTEWKFHNTNTLALSDTLSEADKEHFNIDIRALEWENYFINLTQGVRRYLSYEKPASLEAARRRDTM